MSNSDRATEVPRNKILSYMRNFPSVTELTVTPSKNQKKRFRAIYLLNGELRTTTFGSRYGVTHIDGADDKRRDNYRKRAMHIKNRNGDRTYRIPGSANSFSYWLLW